MPRRASATSTRASARPCCSASSASSIFGLTLPATRLAVAEFDPLFVTAGRSLVAAALACTRPAVGAAAAAAAARMAAARRFAGFSIIGFPLLMAIAMQYAPASHGAVVLAVLPLLTAMGGALVAGERPSLGFWACGVAGTGAVLVYSLLTGAGSGDLQWADLLLAALGGLRGHGLCARRRDGAPHRRLGGDLLGAGVLLAGHAGAGADVGADQLGAPGRRPGPASSMCPCSACSWASSPGTRAWPWAASPGSARSSCCSRSWRWRPPRSLLGETVGWLEIGFAVLVVAHRGARLAHAGGAADLRSAPPAPQFRCQNRRRSAEESGEHSMGRRPMKSIAIAAATCCSGAGDASSGAGAGGGGCGRRLAQPGEPVQRRVLQVRRGPVRQDHQGHRRAEKTDDKNPDAAKRSRPIIGLVIMEGAKKTGANKWSGTLYNRDERQDLLRHRHRQEQGHRLDLSGCVARRPVPHDRPGRGVK